MAAKLGLNMSLGQHQVLKPQQILVSTLLQIPTIMLEQKIKMEIEINPVLEEAEMLEDLQEEEDETVLEEDKKTEEDIKEEFEKIEENSKSEEEKQNEESQDDIDVDELLPEEDNDYPEIRQPRDNSEEIRDMPEVYRASMSEFLMEQIHLLDLNDMEFEVAEYIIHNLRDDGYLDDEVPLESIAQIKEVPLAFVERVLRKVQLIDPPGIAARNLEECLTLQLERINEENEYDLHIRILKESSKDLFNKRFEKVADALGITLEDVVEAMHVIERLNPKPGGGDVDERQNHIIPDFFVEKVDGELVISLNDYKLPGLRISPTYKRMLRQPKKLNRELKKFLKDKVDSAKWFIRAIRQRQATMQKTMEAIVEKQFDFFDKGPEHIKPMIMKDVADEIEMDISTVSRVCKGKYVETEHGVFDLKFFFNEGMQTEDGEDLSTLRIKERIREMVDEEDSRKPLSDEKIAQQLQVEGIPIARRTVAKYREQLDIPVARLRRKI